MEEQLQSGDVVQLKSGGPKMTINRESQNSSSSGGRFYHCVWYNDNLHKYDYNDFRAELLNKIK